MTVTNAFARDVARHRVEIERDRQPFFAGHLAITLDLLIKGGACGHAFFISQSESVATRPPAGSAAEGVERSLHRFLFFTADFLASFFALLFKSDRADW